MNSTFAGNIFCAPETGHVFVIAGKTIDGANRLDINLRASSGGGDVDGIPLHLSVRFDEDVVVRNSQLAGQWGPEERDDNRHPFTVACPPVAGDRFKVYIFVGDNRFHIAINDAAFCTYAFRTPVQDILAVEVLHDLQSLTQFDQRATFPAPLPPLQLGDGVGEEGGGRVEFSNDVPRRFRPGHVVVITAIPYGNARGMFLVRFTEGATRKQALHFNARFDPEYTVVRNAMNDRLEYGAEERDGGFPFFIDEQFKLAIAFGLHEFRFAVNGKLFGTFGYRSVNQLDRLNGLKITAARGMHMEVTGVDHLHMGDAECTDFQSFSHPEWKVMSVADTI